MKNLFLISIKRLLGSFVYKFKRFFLLPVKPQFINFPITYRCNSRCVMCDIWKRYADKKSGVEEELRLEDLKKFIDQNKDWLSDVRHIGITGGEAFLRPDLTDLIRLFREKLPLAKLGIQTNGFLTKSIEKKLKEILVFYPTLSLAVSLDGVEKIHDQVRGVRGAYDSAIETIKMAKGLGIRDITSGMTISRANYDQITRTKEAAEKLGCEFSCFLADEGDYFNNRGKKLGLDEKMKKEVVKQLGSFSYHYYMDNLRLQLQGRRRRQLPCYSGWASIVIDPYGDVRPCILRPEIFGNIKKQSLKEILTSKNANIIRKKIKKCSCWSQCEVSTSAIIDPWDVFRWFLFYADKKRFLTKLLPKSKRFT